MSGLTTPIPAPAPKERRGTCPVCNCRTVERVGAGEWCPRCQGWIVFATDLRTEWRLTRPL